MDIGINAKIEYLLPAGDELHVAFRHAYLINGQLAGGVFQVFCEGRIVIGYLCGDKISLYMSSIPLCAQPVPLQILHGIPNMVHRPDPLHQLHFSLFSATSTLP
jgi:hypothetical protein